MSARSFGQNLFKRLGWDVRRTAYPSSEEVLLTKFLSVARPAAVFDVGANIGFFVLYLNRCLRDASLFAFEPIPETFEVLERNVARHNKLDVKLFNLGLSREPGTATFTYFPRMNVASTMYPNNTPSFRRNSRRFVLDEMRKRGGVLRFLLACTPALLWWPVTEIVRRYYQTTTTVTCQLKTISQVIDEHKLARIDLLKVDAEGAEHDVMAGIRDEHWPLIRQAVVEVHDGHDGLQKMLQVLHSHGFSTQDELPMPDVSHLSLVYAVRDK